MHYLETLNSEQAAAVKHTGGPALVLAGAGSGKTRVLTNRIAFLIEQGIAPDRILAVTFTNKAAREMKERTKELLLVAQIPTGNVSPLVGTFHSICVRFLRRHINHLGYSNQFAIYDTSDQLSVIKKHMKTFDIDPKKYTPRSILNAISSAKTELITPNDYQSFASSAFHEIVAKIYPLYAKSLKEHSALDFDDILSKTVELFRKNPDILQAYQDQFLHVLIDEYQDTNHVQYTLARQLSKKHNNLFAVGDMSQAIYSWRGANIRNILKFKNDYSDAVIYHLERNYRSTQTILDAATSVIKPNKEAHPILNLWTDENQGDPITLYEGYDEHDEAMYITQQIRQHVRNDRSFKDVSVLYRTNAQSRALEELFIRESIPYQLIGNVKFYDRKEIKDIIAYLRYIHNPDDLVSFERIVNTPSRGIGPKTLEAGGPKLDAFFEMMHTIRVAAENATPYEIIDLVLEAIKYKEYLDDGTQEGTARWENVQELRSVAAEYSDLPPGEGLASFLENIALVEQTDMASQANKDLLSGEKVENDAVTLMTLHAAKGLEFPVVFMVGMEEGIFPHNRSLTDQQQLQEERRLCYVGITRARQKLYLTYTRRRLYFGERLPNPPSRFLNDVPQDLLTIEKSNFMSPYESRTNRFAAKAPYTAYGSNYDDEDIYF